MLPIVFGERHTKRLVGKIESEPCDGCGMRLYSVYLLWSYVHIFFIPFLPAGKKRLLVCQECGKEYRERDLGDAKARDTARFKKDAQTPIYQFSGLFLGGLLLGLFLVYAWHVESKNKAEYVRIFDSPRMGDYYVIDNSECQLYERAPTGIGSKKKYDYYLLRLSNLHPDRRGLVRSTFVFDSSYGAQQAIEKGKVNEKDYFVQEVDLIENRKLKECLQDGALHIHRPAK